MHDKELQFLKENYINEQQATLNTIYKLIDEQLNRIDEKSESRFSMTFALPVLSPTEAWGDPSSQSRKEIQKIFAAISGGQDLRARIRSVNSFLDVKLAKSKTSPQRIISMMMIIEALQATLNDFNESAAGFVFEGFLATLTGGKQIAGKVKGTLPIEDFVAFSEFGSEQPVSLKLLSGKTPVKGSFTNLVDFLLVRGAPSIKYMVAYKKVSGDDVVEKLNIMTFDVSIDNFVQFMRSISGGRDLMRTPRYPKVKAKMSVEDAFARYAADGESSLPDIAETIVSMSGYDRGRGLLANYLRTGELPKEKSPEEQEADIAARTASKARDFERTTRGMNLTESVHQAIVDKKLSMNEAFHFLEKNHINNEQLLTEASIGVSQFAASLPQIERLGDTINLEYYGVLDLSQGNIDKLAEIYSETLGDQIKLLLTRTKDLTDNISAYFSEKQRSRAQAAGVTAQQKAKEVKDVLEEDPRFKK